MNIIGRNFYYSSFHDLKNKIHNKKNNIKLTNNNNLL